MKLTDVSYLNCDTLSFADSVAINQLRDSIIKGSKKSHKQVTSEMFSTEMKFAEGCISRWLDKKMQSQHLELDLFKNTRI